MYQLATADRAAAVFGNRVDQQIHDVAAGSARAPRLDPVNKHFRIENKGNDAVKVDSDLGENVVDLLSLRAGARISVEQNAGVLLLQFADFFFTISPMWASGTSRPWLI